MCVQLAPLIDTVKHTTTPKKGAAMTQKATDIRAEFHRKGISISAWALANGFSPNLVFEVLSGRKKGDRGQSHKIAVSLGLKEGEIVSDIGRALDRKAA